MTSTLRPITFVAIVLLSILSAAAPDEEESADTISALAAHMHGHLDEISAIKAAVIAGEIAESREPAMWLATHEEPQGLPDDWLPFVDEMRRHAARAAEAEDLATVAVAVSEIARACGECHLNSGFEVAFGYDQPPAQDMQSVRTQMQRHLWAADRMWEGLIGPSDVAWRRGTEMLAEVQLKASDITNATDEQGRVADLLERIRELGARGGLAASGESRSTLYGQFLSSCSTCHRLTGGGPRAH